MTTRIDSRRLADLCGPGADSLAGTLRATQGLGPLAPWWLGDQARERLRPWQPDLLANWERSHPPASLGSATILLVNREPKSLPLLGGAFLLPLRWHEGGGHSEYLPVGLRRLADRILGQFPEAGRWGLHLHEGAGLSAVDLGGLGEEVCTWDSGWASLAGGLVLAGQGFLPEPDVWASVAWDERFGAGAVDGLAAKLGVAARLGVRHFFVPAENYREALEWVQRREVRIEVARMDVVPRNPQPTRLLRDYLGRLGKRPDRDDPFEKRKGYYQMLPAREKNGYHWDHLVDEIADRCGEGIREEYPECGPSHVVTVVSPSPSAVVQGVRATGARHCLLLHDADLGQAEIASNLGKVRGHLEAAGVRCEEGPINLGRQEANLGAIALRVGAFLEGVAADLIAFDLTPGFKSFSLALDEVAPIGSWLLYCRHRQSPGDGRVEPGTEQYDCWRKGTSVPREEDMS